MKEIKRTKKQQQQAKFLDGKETVKLPSNSLTLPVIPMIAKIHLQKDRRTICLDVLRKLMLVVRSIFSLFLPLPCLCVLCLFVCACIYVIVCTSLFYLSVTVRLSKSLFGGMSI